MTESGLRQRKAARTREAISRAAIELFCSRGFDAVTMTQVADAAQVGRATLFAYFPSKEALVLDRLRDDGPCRAFADRGPGVGLVDALRLHCRGMAGRFGPDEIAGTRRIMGLVLSTPALTDGLFRVLDGQRTDLQALLAAEDPADADGFAAQVAAAQAVGVIHMLQLRFYRRLVAGESIVAASWTGEVDAAFDLLASGLGGRYRKAVA